MMESFWKNRVVGHSERSPEQLLANPLNWRIHPQEQQDALQSVIENVGIVQGVIVNKITGHLVDGHLRVVLAMRAGVKKIPVTFIEVTAEEEKLLLATIDTITEMATADDDKLSELLDSINGNDAINDLLAQLHVDTFLDDSVPEPKKKRRAISITCPQCGFVFAAGEPDGG